MAEEGRGTRGAGACHPPGGGRSSCPRRPGQRRQVGTPRATHRLACGGGTVAVLDEVPGARDADPRGRAVPARGPAACDRGLHGTLDGRGATKRGRGSRGDGPLRRRLRRPARGRRAALEGEEGRPPGPPAPSGQGPGRPERRRWGRRARRSLQGSAARAPSRQQGRPLRGSGGRAPGLSRAGARPVRVPRGLDGGDRGLGAIGPALFELLEVVRVYSKTPVIPRTRGSPSR